MAKLGEVIGYGLLVDRPAAGVEGRLYYATDSEVLARDNGSNWEPISSGGIMVHSSAYVERPAPSRAGNLYLPSDGLMLERDTGTAWSAWGPLFPLVPPRNEDFSWINQGNATVEVTKGGVFLSEPGTAGGESLRLRVKDAPATPYSVTAFVIPTFGSTGHCGVIWRQSSDGKLAVLSLTQRPSRITSSKWPSATTFGTHYVNRNVSDLLMSCQPQWLRIADDGTSRKVSFSYDGLHFYVFHSVSRTDHLTADEVGFYISAIDVPAGSTVGMLLLSWQEA